jgi:hypothetical protein
VMGLSRCEHAHSAVRKITAERPLVTWAMILVTEHRGNASRYKRLPQERRLC